MARLLWKEYREKRLWGLLLLASILYAFIRGGAYTFVGDPRLFDPRIWASFVVAVLLGLSAYSSELAGGTTDFLYSRPVSWKNILLIKLIVAIGVMTAAAIVAAIVYRITAPEQYAPFASPYRLAQGVVYALIIMAPAYLLGLLFSTVLPGVLGSVLTMMVVGIVVMFQIFLYRLYGVDTTFWSICAWLLGIFIATLLTVRFNLSLSTPTRVTRYAVIVAIVLAAISPLDFTVLRYLPRIIQERAIFAINRRLSVDYSWSTVSRDGRYAVVGYGGWVHDDWWDGYNTYFVRIEDGKRAMLRQGGAGQWALDGVTVSISTKAVAIVRMDKNGKLQRDLIRFPDARDMMLRLSPDGRLMFVRWWTKKGAAELGRLEFVDVANRRKLPLAIENVRHAMWVSNNKLAYWDLSNKYHVLRVSK